MPSTAGVDGGRVDHGLIALDIHDDLGVGGGSGLGHAVGSGEMIGAGDHDSRRKIRGGGANALIVGGDHQVGQIAGLRSPFPNMLEHGLTRYGGQGLAGKAGRCIPGGDNA